MLEDTLMSRLKNILMSLVFLFPLEAPAHYSPEELVQHVKKSIENAKNNISTLDQSILDIDGLTGRKVKHLLNNICSLTGASYLEIGVWKGSTFIAALSNNFGLADATAVDNWLFGSQTDFLDNTERYLPGYKFRIFQRDCFSLPMEELGPKKITIYFYDGEHRIQDQYLAFTYFNSIFEDTFIAIVDDYNWEEVQAGTQQAFQELGYTVLFEEHLCPDYSGDRDGWRDGIFDAPGWWNGIYVAVLTKN
jgi:hypothetical protein